MADAPVAGPHEDVHVVHRAQPGIPVVQEGERRALQEHRVDPAPAQLPDDDGRAAEPELVHEPV